MTYKAVALYESSLGTAFRRYDLFVGDEENAHYAAAVTLNIIDKGSAGLRPNENAGLLFLRLNPRMHDTKWEDLLKKRADRGNLEFPSDFAEKLYVEAEIACDEGEAVQDLERILLKQRGKIEKSLSEYMTMLYHEKSEAPSDAKSDGT